MLLGAMTASKYRATTFHLNKSDALTLMSDGLLERLKDKDQMLDSRHLKVEILCPYIPGRFEIGSAS